MNILGNTYRTIIAVFLIMFSLCAFGQRKELSEARENIKKNKNLDKTEASMRNLLKDSANMDNERIWLTLFEAVKKQYEQLNEKLYLKQQSDSAKLFAHTLHMFDVLENLDSLDARPDKNGISKPVYRKSHSAYLNQYRGNLFNGGAYYIKKQNFAEAYNYFDHYIDCINQPLFVDYNYEKEDNRLSEAAYWAVFCGYKLNNADYIDKYAEIALREEGREVYILQYKAEAYRMRNDMTGYMEVIEDAFEKYPTNSYFFSHLAMCYGISERYDDVLRISQQELELDANHVGALLARSIAQLNLGMYKECVETTDRLLMINEELPIAYLNAGLSYYNQTLEYTAKHKLTTEDRKQLTSLYRRALPYLERYRQMNPDDSAKWGEPLYQIYLNLNMGDEFEEIENILSK